MERLGCDQSSYATILSLIRSYYTNTYTMRGPFTILLLFTVAIAFAQPDKTAAFIDAYVKKSNFNGTILIAKKSHPVYKKSFGLADFSLNILNKPETRYKVASITKAFTSVLILQLVEQGNIDLEKPIITYLPEYKGAGGNKVTIRQLLNMTSGMRNMDENGSSLEGVLKNGLPQYQLPNTSDQMLEKFCSMELVKEPGKEFDYNNADFIILGKIIEKLSGKSFTGKNTGSTKLNQFRNADSEHNYKRSGKYLFL